MAEGTGISLVGGNITVEGGTLTAPSGNINLVSVSKPSSPNVGGEVAANAPGQGFNTTGFRTFGTINLSQGSTVDASVPSGSVNDAGTVSIRAGHLVMNDSTIKAVVTNHLLPGNAGGTIEVTAEQVTLSNHSTIDVSADENAGINPPFESPGRITFNVGSFSATDSAILAPGGEFTTSGGSVTIQGLQGSDAFARSVSLTMTELNTHSSAGGSFGAPGKGPILIRADKIALNQSTLDVAAGQRSAGAITLESRGDLAVQNSSFLATSDFGVGGTINLNAGTKIDLMGTIIMASTALGFSGASITLTAPVISLSSTTLDVSGPYTTPGATIRLTGTRAVSLTNTVLFADSNNPCTVCDGGTILINGGLHHSYKLVLASSIWCMSLSSCADTIIINRLAPISESEPSSEVMLCRKSFFYGYAAGSVFHLDGNPLFRSSAAKYTKLRVRPGKHIVGLRGMGPTGPLESEKEFQAGSGKAFYFYTDVDTVYQGTEADVKEWFDYEYVPVQ